jgi:hypothetical protein
VQLQSTFESFSHFVDHVNVGIPPDDAEIDFEQDYEGLKNTIGSTKPLKPLAFIMGSGLWSGLVAQRTADWLDEISNITISNLHYLEEPTAFWPRLFISPSASGINKPRKYSLDQGNTVLANFQNGMAKETEDRGIDHLGSWNMTLNTTSIDGT